MGLFKRKQGSAVECQCACGGADEAGCETASGARGARVQVLGTGCKKCHALYENAVEALGENAVEYVTDMGRVAASGVMSLPALVVDGKAVSDGRVLSPEEITALV